MTLNGTRFGTIEYQANDLIRFEGGLIGFPLLTALALKHITAAHSVVFVALLPLSTAIFGVLRGGEHPRPARVRGFVRHRQPRDP